MSERPGDFFTMIPRRFIDARKADDIDGVDLLIGVHVATDCFDALNISDGVAAVRIANLAELCERSEQNIRVRLHELRKKGWLDFEQPAPGQRAAWRIWLVGLAHEGTDSTPAPQTNNRPTTKTPLPVLSSSSTSSSLELGANRQGESDGTSPQAQQADFEQQDIRDETKRDEYERKAASSEDLDHLGVETTAAGDDLLDAIERARLFDEMFPPRSRRAS
jgi:hypothetical protein